jgi:hypothetical protein
LKAAAAECDKECKMTDHEFPASPQLQLEEIGQIAVTVSDLNRSKNF